MASTGELRNDDLVVAPDGTVEIVVSAEQPRGGQLAARSPTTPR